mmetsp:Transcript_22983/g.50448  ORF Transcript_22983/g.50448 Transcript_22983/m.50448 type:complete len:329 (+) Transcript_22983:3-989(+)
MVALQAPARQLHVSELGLWAGRSQALSWPAYVVKAPPGDTQAGLPLGPHIQAGLLLQQRYNSVVPHGFSGICLDAMAGAPLSTWEAADAQVQEAEAAAAAAAAGSRAEPGGPEDGRPGSSREVVQAYAQLSAAVCMCLGWKSASPDPFLWWCALTMGHKALTCDFLTSLLQSPACVYWWPRFGSMAVGDLPRLVLCQCVEMVLEQEEPLLWGAFHMAGHSPSHACSRWLSTAFVGQLPPDEVFRVQAVALGFGPDYMVYSCLAVLKHMEGELLGAHAERACLVPWLHCRGLADFEVARHMPYMSALAGRYRAAVLGLMFASGESAPQR